MPITVVKSAVRVTYTLKWSGLSVPIKSLSRGSRFFSPLGMARRESAGLQDVPQRPDEVQVEFGISFSAQSSRDSRIHRGRRKLQGHPHLEAVPTRRGSELSEGSRSTSLPHSKRAPARTSATRWGVLTARQRSWAASISLNAMAIPAALEPGPLVTLVRCLTVAKVNSMGLDLP